MSTGRHRVPATPTAPRLLAAGLAVTGPLLLPVLTAPDASAAETSDVLGAIARCESGGNIRATNPRSTASGKYQFLDSTWRGLGGSGRAKDAPESVQDAMAAKLLAQSGTAPWNPSRTCWSKQVGTVAPGAAPARPTAVGRTVASAPKTARPAERPAEPKRDTVGKTNHDTEHANQRKTGRRTVAPSTSATGAGAGTAIPDGYVIRRGDTLSKLAARYQVPGGAAAIAKANHIGNPDLIFAGATLR